MRKIALSLLISLFASSCSSGKIKNFDAYSPAPAVTNPNFSKEKIADEKVKIVIILPDDSDIKQAKSANISELLAGEIENILAKEKLVEIIDRSAYKKLGEEIKLNELSDSDEFFTGPKKADYAISAKITKANLENKYIAARHFYDLKNKTFINEPAKFKYMANVSANINIYKLPSVEVSDSFAFEGESFRTENAPTERKFIFSSKVNMDALKTEDIGLLTQAASEGIKDVSTDLRNFFASLDKAYIFAKKEYKNKYIFQISFGKDNGLKQGEKLEIYSTTEIHNPLDDSRKIEEVKLGQAIVSNIIFAESAWIIVKDKEIANKLQLGDYVKRSFKRSSFEKFGDITGSANKLLF